MTKHVNIITDPTEADTAIREQHIAREIGTELQKHYPGRMWMVQVDINAGMADIICPSVSPQYGYAIHINEPIMILRQKAKLAGGEILERFGLSRDKRADDDIEGLAKNALGFTKGLKHGGI